MSKKVEVVLPTLEELEKELKAFKKSDKVRREVLADRKGFADSEIYLKNLQKLILKKSVVKESEPTKIEEIVEKVEEVKVEETKLDEIQPMDIVYAFDTTGSMAFYIESVKEHVKKLVPEMLENIPNLKIKIVAFGDYEDMTSKQLFGKAYQESELTDDADKLISFIQSAINTYGGDADEFYELVIKKIVEETPWRENSVKSVVLIGDYTPHPIGYRHKNLIGSNTIDWKKECKKAKKAGIKFDTLSILNYGEQKDFYSQVSEITGGVNMPFVSSSKMSSVVGATAYANAATRTSDTTSSTIFYTMASTVTMDGDDELIGTYKSLSTKL